MTYFVQLLSCSQIPAHLLTSSSTLNPLLLKPVFIPSMTNTFKFKNVSVGAWKSSDLVHGPSSRPPTCGRLTTVLSYTQTPPTHYYLESSGQMAYRETHRKTAQSHDNLSQTYILAPNKKIMVDPRISKDSNTSMTGCLFQDTNDANIQVAWMRAGIVDSLQNIPGVYICTAGIYMHISWWRARSWKC